MPPSFTKSSVSRLPNRVRHVFLNAPIVRKSQASGHCPSYYCLRSAPGRVEDWRSTGRFGPSVFSPFPLGVPQSPNPEPISSPLLIARSVRISRTTRSCTLRVKGYGTYRAGDAFEDGHTIAWYSHSLLHLFQPKPRRSRAFIRSPKAPGRFSLRLDVDPSPQVLQTDGCLYHWHPCLPCW